MKFYQITKLLKTGVCLLTLLALTDIATANSDARLIKTTFNDLPGWQQADLQTSFYAYQRSCKALLKTKFPDKIASIAVPFNLKDWQTPCQQALKYKTITKAQARQFFQTHFIPVAVHAGHESEGLFTGYYLPTIKASLVKNKTYSVPVYGRPKDLVTTRLGWFNKGLKNEKLAGKVVNGHLYPYAMPRKLINQGALKDKAKVLVWVKTRADRFFLQIQGSGVVILPSGKKMLLIYDGENGERYYPIGRWLLEQGILSKHNVSMQTIKAWLLAHPEKGRWLMNKNESFIFFDLVDSPRAFGTDKIPLTPYYSLAVNTKIIPLGTPVWLQTKLPQAHDVSEHKPLQRLMIAQDTGGAIRGVIRGDIYFGAGEKEAELAGHMQNRGRYWMLLPKTYVSKM